MLRSELSFKVTLYSKLSRRWQASCNLLSYNLRPEKQNWRERCFSHFSKLKQNFKKESLLQIATEFHLISHLQNGNKETKIVRVAHIQIGITKEKYNQEHGRPFATLSFATFATFTIKKIERERERERDAPPSCPNCNKISRERSSQNRNKFSPPLSSLKSQQKNKNNYNETKNSQRRTHAQQVLFAETTLVALILSTQGTKHFAQFCLQRQRSPHRSENFICLETTFTVLFSSTIAAQQNKFT